MTTNLSVSHERRGHVIKRNCKSNMKKRRFFPNPEYNQHVEKNFHGRSSRMVDLTNEWIVLQPLLKCVAMQA